MSEPYLPLQVISSQLSLGTDTEGWNLDVPAAEEDPEREFSFDVFFDSPFSNHPVVHLGIVGFDIDQCSSSRLQLAPSEISREGFQVTLRTWRSSRLYSVDLSWVAIGS